MNNLAGPRRDAAKANLSSKKSRTQKDLDHSNGELSRPSPSNFVPISCEKAKVLVKSPSSSGSFEPEQSIRRPDALGVCFDVESRCELDSMAGISGRHEQSNDF